MFGSTFLLEQKVATSTSSEMRHSRHRRRSSHAKLHLDDRDGGSMGDAVALMKEMQVRMCEYGGLMYDNEED